MRWWNRRAAGGGALILAVATLFSPAGAAEAADRPFDDPSEVTCGAPGWLTSWQAVSGGPQRVASENTASPLYYFESYPLALPNPVSHRSLRMIVTPQNPGSAVRFRFSNRYGKLPVTFADVSVARQSGTASAALVPGTSVPLTFGGSRSVRVQPGQEVFTDPVAYDVGAFDKLAVSFYVPEWLAPEPTYHWDNNTTSFLSPFGSGNKVGDADGSAFTQRTSSTYFVNRADVFASAGESAIVAVGDSFMNSITTTADADRRWPDLLNRRIDAEAPGSGVSVVNSAVSFNFAVDGVNDTLFGGVLGWGGESVNERFSHDVAEVPGARAVLLMIGMNDLAFFTPGSKVIDAYRRFVAQAHAEGLKVIGVTLTPTKGAPLIAAGYELPTTLVERAKVNEFIRSGNLFDAVLDLDKAVQDPADPLRWRSDLSTDRIHPNDAGAAVEAAAVDLATVQRLTGC